MVLSEQFLNILREPKIRFISPHLPAADFCVPPPAVVIGAISQILFVVFFVIVHNVIVIGSSYIAVSCPCVFHCRWQHGGRKMTSRDASLNAQLVLYKII
jgi:hypothetical protein